MLCCRSSAFPHAAEDDPRTYEKSYAHDNETGESRMLIADLDIDKRPIPPDTWARRERD